MGQGQAFKLKPVLSAIYRRLLTTFGPQHWWPGETPFEVAVGAILTQGTNWTNAERAIGCLKKERSLHPRALVKLPHRRLAGLVRSSGYFNQKARRLKTFVSYLLARYAGDMRRMRGNSVSKLRRELLDLSGIGPETADSILLYALEKPIFVVDAYTRRILARHSLISWKASYDHIQALFMENLPLKARFFNEYHALLVALGKHLCLKKRPKCHLCPLRNVGRLRLEPNAA